MIPYTTPAGFSLDAARTPDQDVTDERWLEETVLDQAGYVRQPPSELLWVADVAEIIGDQVSIWTRGDIAQTRGRRCSQGALCPKAHDLQWNGRAQCAHRLLGRGDHDEAPGGRGDDLLARVGGPAALDQPSVRVDLVGAVDGYVERA
jgi:hypothetical protein